LPRSLEETKLCSEGSEQLGTEPADESSQYWVCSLPLGDRNDHCASAQNLNVDLGDVAGSPPNSYTAAGTAGVWNTLNIEAAALLEIEGSAGTVAVTVSSDSLSACPAVPPDGELLGDNVFDCNGVPEWSLGFTGLTNGDYSVVLYAPSHASIETGDMLVNGVAVGSLLGSSTLQAGVSHSFVFTEVSGGTLDISGLGGSSGLCAGLAGLQINALGMPGPILIYREDFEGEVSFSPQPEVDMFSTADTFSVAVDGNLAPFAAPFPSGGAVLGSIHSEFPPSTQNVHVPSTFTDSFEIRATVDSLSLGLPSADASARVGVLGLFGTLLVPTSVVDAGFDLSRAGGSTSDGIAVTYSETPAAPLSTFTPLDLGAIAAILSGTSFTIDLTFDKTTMIATGSIDISGVGAFPTPPLDASAIARIAVSTPLGDAALYATERLGLDLDVNMEDISAFVPGATPVPSIPLPGLAVLTALLAAAGGRILRQR
jgi:hypothetical protein